ncbi:hypothetical protein, partial [Saccharothrix longispora]|uniref:hypothetical protein n=1 Tax=Saccharothrix longispora TaxID=33920 RepID=UPI0028FD3015
MPWWSSVRNRRSSATQCRVLTPHRHAVWVDDEDRFVNIGDLKPGDQLTSADDGAPTVTDVERYTHFEPV